MCVCVCVCFGWFLFLFTLDTILFSVLGTLAPFQVRVAFHIIMFSRFTFIILEILWNRSLPALAWHRQNWNVVYPYVHLSEPEAEDLATISHFVAGVTEAAAEGRSDFKM